MSNTRRAPVEGSDEPVMKTLPFRLTLAEHTVLKDISMAESRTMQAVIMLALRDKYPEFDRAAARRGL
jgi:hypothetical protein